MTKLEKENWGVTSQDWSNWKWQLTHSVSTIEELRQFTDLSEEEYESIDECLKKFSMRVTPYFLSLIDWDDPNDPIKAQAIPQKEELIVEEWEKSDPLAEDEKSPVKGLVHRYPDRVLFLTTPCCAMYCRHCTRKRFAGDCEKTPTVNQYKKCIEYIKQHTEVRDVLLSGGDPLMLKLETLDWILTQLREIPHVEVIRIGSRVPVTLPQKVTPELCTMLSKHHPLWMNIQVNHPNELTPEVEKACSMLSGAGIPLGNQSVLLKGVNDNLEVMKELVHKLVKFRIRPYYLYQCDLSYGLHHFRTPVIKGIEIIKGLRGFTSGFCVPQFVIDAPNGGGKVPINPSYIKDWDDTGITFFNYEGNKYWYPDKDDQK